MMTLRHQKSVIFVEHHWCWGLCYFVDCISGM